MTDYDALADLYDCEWQELVDDIPFIESLARRSGGPILELACGTGRVTLPLAGGGYAVTGVDNSAAMLALARRKVAALPGDAAARVRFELGDMADLRVDGTFPFICIPCNSFGLLTSKAAQESCLRGVRKHLAGEGLFLVDVFSPRFELCAEAAPPIRFLRRFYVPAARKTVIQWELVRRDMVEQVMEIDFLYEEFDGDGRLTQRTHHLSMGILFRFEMQFMLEKHGFEVVEFYGNYDRSPFTADSPQMIYVCRKAGPR